MSRTSRTAASSGVGHTRWSMRVGLFHHRRDLAAARRCRSSCAPVSAGRWPCRRTGPRRWRTEGVDARGRWQPVGELAGGLRTAGRCPARQKPDEVLQRQHAEGARALEQPVEHLDGGAGVGQRPVDRHRAACEELRQRGQLAVAHLVAHQPARELRGADDRIGQRRVGQPRKAGVEKADVEARVVRHQRRALAELEERRQDGLDGGRVARPSRR